MQLLLLFSGYGPKWVRTYWERNNLIWGHGTCGSELGGSLFSSCLSMIVRPHVLFGCCVCMCFINCPATCAVWVLRVHVFHKLTGHMCCLGVVCACVSHFGICTGSAQLSMFHVERCSRNTIIIIIIIWLIHMSIVWVGAVHYIYRKLCVSLLLSFSHSLWAMMVRSTQISCSLHSVCVSLSVYLSYFPSLTLFEQWWSDPPRSLVHFTLCVCVSLSVSLLLSLSLSKDGQIHPDLLFTSLCVCVSLSYQGWWDPPRSPVHFTLCVCVSLSISPTFLLSLFEQWWSDPPRSPVHFTLCVCLSLYLSYFPSHWARMVRSTQISCSLHSVCVSYQGWSDPPRSPVHFTLCVCVCLSLSVSLLLSLSLSNDGQIHPDLLFTSLCVCLSLTKDGEIHPDLLFTSLCVCVCLSLYLSYFPSLSLFEQWWSDPPRSLVHFTLCVCLVLCISPAFPLSLCLSEETKLKRAG